MAVKCDLTNHMVKYGAEVTVNETLVKDGKKIEKGKKVRQVVEEKFVRCMQERAHIIATPVGRVGLCPSHFQKYTEMDAADQRSFFRTLYGQIVGGAPQEMATAK